MTSDTPRTIAPTRVPWPADAYGRAFRVTLALFIGTIVFSAAGMLLLTWVPASMRVFGPYLLELIQAPTWIYMVLLPVLPILMYARSVQPRRLVFFVLWGSAVGGASELIGTTGLLEVGDLTLPFGAYHYTDMLGPKMLGHVPYFIPFSWFAMSILSLDLAGRIAAGRTGRILMGTAFMVLWDVALDPAMSTGTALAPLFWTYADPGFFYGMPLSNWLGWTIVSLVIMTGYELIGGGLRTASAWAPLVYFLNGAFPLAIVLIVGLEGAFMAGALAVAAPLLLVHLYGRPATDHQP